MGLPRWGAARCVAVALLALQASWTGAQELDEALREQVLAVPRSGLTEPELEVTVFRPPGDGPHAVVVINHGRAYGPAKLQARYRPMVATRWFVNLGYAVVVPMRQGFSQSGGAEITGGCNVYSNGEQQARSVRRTLDWLQGQPWADVSRNLVIGQSHGGLTTLAYGMAPHPGTRLLVNFAGGLRQPDCLNWERTLTQAIGDYGQATKLPGLWFYGDNDSYFAPEVWREAHARYVQAGARAELIAFGPFGKDAHTLFTSRAGLPIWKEPMLKALQAQGLPHQPLFAISEPADVATPPASNFARVEDIDRVPLRNDRAREGYQSWQRAESPKAFAIHPTTGHWGWAWGGARPLARALATCERLAKAPCKLYAVDDTVVWSPE